MRNETLAFVLFVTTFPLNVHAQTTPHLSKVPTVTDTQLSGSAQGVSTAFDTISLYVCTSASPIPVDCSAESTPQGQKITLVNLGGSGFAVNTPDGKFTITLAAPLPPGTFVWIVQKTTARADHTEVSTISTPVRVPVPLLRKASVSITGYDSASRDIGGKVTLDFDHGLPNEGWGQTTLLTSGTYDDKWKSTPLSSNVTQNYSGQLSQLIDLSPSTAWGPYASAYHNNTQGIRVEQIYGAGVTQVVKLRKGYYLSLILGMQAMLDNLYAPGGSTNLGGVHVGAELDHQFRNRISIDLKLGVTPVFTQSRAWTAAGDFDLLVPISRRWSLQFEVADNYYEIAPKTFNKNYLAPSIGIAFK
jgi:hypothetical protein